MQAWRMIDKITENFEKISRDLAAFLKRLLILLFKQIWNLKRWTILSLTAYQPSDLVAQHQKVSQTRREIDVS